MTTYRIGSVLVHPEQSDIANLLEAAYKAKMQPFCMCKGEPGLPMHIAHIGEGYFLRRNPRTGTQHEVGCGSWEMPDEFSGRSDVASSISYEDGKMMLRLGFPLAKQGNRVAPPPKVGSNEDKLSVNNGGKKLSLQGLLHELWHGAGLDTWHSGDPNRRWDDVYAGVLESAKDMIVKQHPLPHYMFVPEPYVRESAEEQKVARRKRFIELAVSSGGKKGGHQLMLLIAEQKGTIRPSELGGFRLTVKHVPEFEFFVNDELMARIEKHYAKESNAIRATEEKWSHQVIAATFTVRAEGTAEIEEICYMPVTSQWVPFDNIYENDLITQLVVRKRSFIRPLRYNRLKTSIMPTAVLTDTGSGPTALYLVAPDQDSVKVQSASLEVDYNKWIWDTKESADMPELPPRLEATPEEIEYLKKMNAPLPVSHASSPAPVFTPAGPPAHPFLKSPAPAANKTATPAQPLQQSRTASTSASTVSAPVQPGPVAITNGGVAGLAAAPAVQTPARVSDVNPPAGSNAAKVAVSAQPVQSQHRPPRATIASPAVRPATVSAVAPSVQTPPAVTTPAPTPTPVSSTPAARPAVSVAGAPVTAAPRQIQNMAPRPTAPVSHATPRPVQVLPGSPRPATAPVTSPAAVNGQRPVQQSTAVPQAQSARPLVQGHQMPGSAVLPRPASPGSPTASTVVRRPAPVVNSASTAGQRPTGALPPRPAQASQVPVVKPASAPTGQQTISPGARPAISQAQTVTGAAKPVAVPEPAGSPTVMPPAQPGPQVLSGN